MIHNYFFLKRLEGELNERLKGTQVCECFSQNKEEIVFGFGNKNQQFFVKATLESQVGLLHFITDYARAKKNSVDLFPLILDKKVQSVRVFDYERSFEITLEYDLSILFKMHGSRANIIITKQKRVVDIFRKKLASDLQLNPDSLSKKLPDFELFNSANGIPSKCLPALGKEIIQACFPPEYYHLSI